jgi:hypothetical protein
VNAEGGGFQVVAACIGSAHASAFDGTHLFLSDALGRVYRHDPGSGTLIQFATVPSDARGLAEHGNQLFVGGSAGGTIQRIDKTTGANVGTFTVEHNVTAMTTSGSHLFVGGDTGAITGIDLGGGPPTFLGTCSGPIASMTSDATHVVVGTNSGWVFRMNMATGQTEGAFLVDSDCTALAMHGGSVLVAGTNGSVKRFHRITGAAQGSTLWEFDIRAMTAARTDPSVAFGFGTACPCANVDVSGGCRNSTSVGAVLGASGSASATADDLTLSAFNLPPNSFGRIFMGTSTNGVNFGDGRLTVTGGAGGLIRYPVQNSMSEGRISFGPGMGAFAATHFGPSGQLAAGTTWSFQAYYRDTLGPCGTGFNTTNAVNVSFVP